MSITKSLLLPLLLIGALAAPVPVFASGYGYGGGDSNSDSRYSTDDARSLIDRGRYRDAIGILRHIIDAQPRNADALNMLGFSLRKTGDVRNAQGYYLKALKIRPDHRGANEYLGELYVEIGQMAKARERLEALGDICGTSCREYRTLKGVIDAAS